MRQQVLTALLRCFAVKGRRESRQQQGRNRVKMGFSLTEKGVRPSLQRHGKAVVSKGPHCCQVKETLLLLSCWPDPAKG